MKGPTLGSYATLNAKKFQSDDIITQRVHLPEGIELFATLKQMVEQNKKLTTEVSRLTEKVKELEDKYNELETE